MREPTEEERKRVITVNHGQLLAIGNTIMRLCNIIAKNRSVGAALHCADEEYNQEHKRHHSILEDTIASLNILSAMLETDQVNVAKFVVNKELSDALRKARGGK